jgi:hypothetical protein
LRLGRGGDALVAFKEASARDDRALDDPVTLLAWARANARAHHVAEAVRAYRVLLPKATALPAHERAAAPFEAGMLTMSQGPDGLTVAIAMLRQARHDAQDALYAASVVALALALDRAGEHDEAASLLFVSTASKETFAEDSRAARALGDAGVPEEGDALAALALEASDPVGARAVWRRYLDGRAGKGAWAAHARAHENLVRSAAARPTRGAR